MIENDANDPELRAVDRYLRETAAATRAEARLASPHQLLWKAELRARTRAAERAVRPLTLCRNLALGLSAGAGVLLLASGTLPLADVGRFFRLAPGLGALGTTVLAAAALATLWLYSSWVEG